MFEKITYHLIFGKPLIMYAGIITILSFFFTAYIGYTNYKGKARIPFKYHPVMAAISLTLAFLHGLMGILAYF